MSPRKLQHIVYSLIRYLRSPRQQRREPSAYHALSSAQRSILVSSVREAMSSETTASQRAIAEAKIAEIGGDAENSLLLLEKAARDVDDSETASIIHGEMAAVLVRIGRYREAIAAYDRAVSCGGSVRLVLLAEKAVALAKVGDFEHAIRTMQQALRSIVENPSSGDLAPTLMYYQETARQVLIDAGRVDDADRLAAMAADVFRKI